MEKEFCVIDMNTWSRSQTYHYFTERVTPISYSINVTIDVTIIRKTLKSKGIKFFPAYLYLVSRAIEKQQELCLALNDGILGYWNFLNPQYPVFHEDDKTITFLWTEYEENFNVFYKQYLNNCALYGKDHGIMSSKGAPPENSYIISCIPWFTFNSLSMHLQDVENYYVPMIEAGGFVESNGVITMPLSITINHAAADGYQIKIFLDELQWSMNHPEEWLIVYVENEYNKVLN